MTYTDVAADEDVKEGKPAVAHVAGVDVAVFRVGGELYATNRFCPHARGDLSDGTIEGCQLTCPDHGWSFELETGACLKKSGGKPLRVFPCRVRDGRIEVELS